MATVRPITSPAPALAPSLPGRKLPAASALDQKVLATMRSHVHLTPPDVQPSVLSSAGRNTTFVVNDAGFLHRALPSTVIGTAVPNITGIHSAVALTVLEALRVPEAVQSYDVAKAAQDSTAMGLAVVDGVTHIAGTGGGAGLLAGRIATLESLSHPSAVTTTVATSFMQAGCGLLGVFFLLIGASSIHRLYQNYRLNQDIKEMARTGDPHTATLRALQKRLELIPPALKPDDIERLENETREMLGMTARQMEKALKLPGFLQQHMQESMGKLQELGYSEAETTRLAASSGPLLIIGLARREALRAEGLERALTSLVGSENVERVKTKDPHLTEEVQKVLNKENWVHAGAAALCAFAILVLVAVCILAPPGWLILAAGIGSVLLAIGMAVCDNYYAKLGFEASGPIGRHDKLFIRLSAVLMAVCLVVGVTVALLTAATLFMALSYIAPALIVFLIAMLIYGNAMRRLDAQETGWEEELRDRKIRATQRADKLDAEQHARVLAAQPAAKTPAAPIPPLAPPLGTQPETAAKTPAVHTPAPIPLLGRKPETEGWTPWIIRGLWNAARWANEA